MERSKNLAPFDHACGGRDAGNNRDLRWCLRLGRHTECVCDLSRYYLEELALAHGRGDIDGHQSGMVRINARRNWDVADARSLATESMVIQAREVVMRIEPVGLEESRMHLGMNSLRKVGSATSSVAFPQEIFKSRHKCCSAGSYYLISTHRYQNSPVPNRTVNIYERVRGMGSGGTSCPCPETQA